MKHTYFVTEGVSLLENEDEHGGYCKKGHYNIIPACTKLTVNNKLYCQICKTLIYKVILIKRTDEELSHTVNKEFK